MIRPPQAYAARKRYQQIAPVLNEQSRRRFVALEARALGRGGVSFMARMTGLARSTIYRGVSDLRNNVTTLPGRIRKEGGGRKKKILEDPTLLRDLKRLVEPATRGDRMQPLLWTSRSLRNLVKELAQRGHKVCPTVVGNLLRGLGYSLQANHKTREGSSHIDRDAQFRYINTQATAFLKAGEPVVSVDTKKKELVGNYRNNGREWREKGTPEEVNVHDFIDPDLPRAVPYDVYDLTNNVGWVSVGTDHDTASFAVNAIRRWWTTMGKERHPKATRLMITADGGRQQRLPGPVMENRTAEPSQRAQISHHGLSFPTWNQQVEQNRASPLFIYQYQLAWQAATHLSHDRPTDRGGDNQRGA